MSQDDFEGRIAKLRASRGQPGGKEASSGNDPGIPGAMNFGLRAGAQFVSAVMVGGGLGWAIDRWLGTSPFGMLILMVLAFIGAMVNVWLMMSRAVTVAEASNGAAAGNGITDKTDGKSS
jgi:F0F1-type ATP synthase assembly protein I